MGNSGWDDDTWRRGRSPREGRSPDAGRSQSRSARGSARGWGDDGARGSSQSWERSRERDRSGSSGRGGGGDDGRSGSGSRRGGPGAAYERSSSRSRPMERDEYANGRPGDRSMRGPRPSSRDDGYGPPRHRHHHDGPPGASSGRNRPAERGAGLWGDDGGRHRRPGPGAGGPPGMRGAGRPDPRDPRLARRPMAGAAAEEDDEEESSFGPGKAVLVVLMMFVLGAAAGFGYFRFSAPTVHTDSNNNQQQRTPSASPSASPSGTPSTTPAATTTPQADVRPTDGSGGHYIIVVRSAV